MWGCLSDESSENVLHLSTRRKVCTHVELTVKDVHGASYDFAAVYVEVDTDDAKLKWIVDVRVADVPRTMSDLERYSDAFEKLNKKTKQGENDEPETSRQNRR